MNSRYSTKRRDGRRIIQIEVGSVAVVVGFPQIAEGRASDILRDLADEIEGDNDGH